jgi:hypothetical protein
LSQLAAALREKSEQSAEGKTMEQRMGNSIDCATYHLKLFNEICNKVTDFSNFF